MMHRLMVIGSILGTILWAFILYTHLVYSKSHSEYMPTCGFLLGLHLNSPNVKCKMTYTGPRIDVAFPELKNFPFERLREITQYVKQRMTELEGPFIAIKKTPIVIIKWPNFILKSNHSLKDKSLWITIRRAGVKLI